MNREPISLALISKLRKVQDQKVCVTYLSKGCISAKQFQGVVPPFFIFQYACDVTTGELNASSTGRFHRAVARGVLGGGGGGG